jgi:WD40 repeat protein
MQGLLHRHKVPIRWAAFSADGRRLVTASPDRCVLLWDVTSLDMLRALPGEPLQLLAACRLLCCCQ